MLFLIKGHLDTGSLARRLREKLGLRPARWPFDSEEVAEWESVFEGQDRALAGFGFATDEFVAPGHVNVDRLAGLLALRHHESLAASPPPPPGVGAERFGLWMNEQVTTVLQGPHSRELFDLTCRMIESMDHPIVEGVLLGTRRDSWLTRQILFKYQGWEILKVALLPAVDGTRVEVLGHALTVDELVAAVNRDADGGVSLAPPLRG